MIRNLAILTVLVAFVSATVVGCASSASPNALRGSEPAKQVNDKGRAL